MLTGDTRATTRSDHFWHAWCVMSPSSSDAGAVNATFLLAIKENHTTRHGACAKINAVP